MIVDSRVEDDWTMAGSRKGLCSIVCALSRVLGIIVNVVRVLAMLCFDLYLTEYV